MRKITAVINGKIYKGLAYWSDRTIPGRWIYPAWYDKRKQDNG